MNWKHRHPVSWYCQLQPATDLACPGASAPGRYRMRGFPVLLMLLVAWFAPSIAFAHAEFRGSEPAANTVLDHAPGEVVLRFSEPVSPLVIRLSTAGQDAVDVEAHSRDAQVIVPLPADLGSGTHLLSWRVVSVDGHPIGGTLVFSVGVVSEAHDTHVENQGAAGLAAVARFGLTLALVAGIGGTVFIVLVARAISPAAPIQWYAWFGAVAVFPLAALAIGVQGLDLMGMSSGEFLSASAWRAGLSSPVAVTALLAALASLAAIDALHLTIARERLQRGLVAWVLAGASFAVSGHAAVADPRWIAVPAVALHGFALIFWMGCLLPLLVLLYTEEDATPVVARFSTIAVPLVAILVATGALLTALQSGSVGALLRSSYGAILMIKLVAVAGLLILALRNRLRFTPGLEAGLLAARWRMTRAIRLEILLGLLVLVLASSFRLTPPPRSFAAQMPMLIVEVAGQEVKGSITLTPGLVGVNDLSVRLFDRHGMTLDPRSVTLRFSMPAQQIEPIVLPAVRSPDDSWKADQVALPITGEWTVEVDVLINDFQKEKLASVLPIAVG